MPEVNQRDNGAMHMRMQIFPTKDFSTFPDALAEVARQDVFQANIPSAAAFACAGPVQNSKCEMTNLSWIIDGPYLSHTHGIRCFAPPAPQACMMSEKLALPAGASRGMHAQGTCSARIHVSGMAAGRMAVLNDFEANGYGVTALEPEHVVVLNDVPPAPKVLFFAPDAPSLDGSAIPCRASACCCGVEQ